MEPRELRTLSRLQAMVDLRDVPRKRLAELTGVNENTIGGWLKDGTDPRFVSQLAAVSSVLDTSLSYVQSPEPIPLLGMPHFRHTRHFQIQKVSANARAYGFMIGEAMRLLHEGMDPPARPVGKLPPSNGVDPRVAARALRKHARVGDAAIDNMWDFAAMLGVVVVFGPVEHQQLDAYSLTVDGRGVIVLSPVMRRVKGIMLEKPVERLRFDIAHELGHLLLHPRHEPGVRVAREEREANSFAGELLYPTSDRSVRALRQAVQNPGHWQQLLQLKQSKGMSLHALLTHGETLGVVDGTLKRKWSQAYTDAGWRSTPELSMGRTERVRNVLRDASARLEPDIVHPEVLLEFGLPADVVGLVVATEPTPISLRHAHPTSVQVELDIPVSI